MFLVTGKYENFSYRVQTSMSSVSMFVSTGNPRYARLPHQAVFTDVRWILIHCTAAFGSLVTPCLSLSHTCGNTTVFVWVGDRVYRYCLTKYINNMRLIDPYIYTVLNIQTKQHYHCLSHTYSSSVEFPCVQERVGRR